VSALPLIGASVAGEWARLGMICVVVLVLQVARRDQARAKPDRPCHAGSQSQLCAQAGCFE